MSHRMSLVVVLVSVIVLLATGCGVNTTTHSEFRSDCVKNGGTFVDTNGREEQCIYNEEQP